MERLEDLLVNNLKIYQDDALYKFTSDSVLLSKFTSVKKGDVVADFCSGSGIVGLHLYGLNSEKIRSVHLFEMQKPIYDLSVKSIKYNGLENVFTAVNTRVQEVDKSFNEKFSLITCNPPYMSVDRGFSIDSKTVDLSKNESALPLNELIRAVSRCLKFGGRVNLVHRADRLAEIIVLMKNENIEPKKLQFVSGGKKPPYLLLIEGVKGGKPGIKVLNATEN